MCVRFLSVLFGAALLLAGCALSPAAQPRAWPEPNVTVPHYDPADLEIRVLHAVNRMRRSEGRAVLRRDARLVAIARRHSQDMSARGFVAHRNPDGATPGERAAEAGYAFRSFGENLFRGHLYDTRSLSRRGSTSHVAYRWHTPDGLAALVASMWMDSPSHRENMLADYAYGGVGIALGPEGEVLVTLNLSVL